jgi:hypothetical protein
MFDSQNIALCIFEPDSFAPPAVAMLTVLFGAFDWESVALSIEPVESTGR